MPPLHSSKPGLEFKKVKDTAKPSGPRMSGSPDPTREALLAISNRRRVTAALSQKLQRLKSCAGQPDSLFQDHAKAEKGALSPEKANPIFTGIQPEGPRPLAGSMNDAPLVRAVLVRSIRQSNKSREQIADEMSYLVGRKITERMLNAFTAESKEDNRWHAELDRAFCHVTGSDELLLCRLDRAGLVVITKDDVEILELGRQYLRRKEADAQMARLEASVERRVQT
jgi:hypothetical protein